MYTKIVHFRAKFLLVSKCIQSIPSPSGFYPYTWWAQLAPSKT